MDEKNIFTIVEYEEETVIGMNHVLELRMNGKRKYRLLQTYEMNDAQRESSRKVFMERVRIYLDKFNGILVRN